MSLFSAAIRRDSFYLLRFPFLSHVQVIFLLFVFWNVYTDVLLSFYLFSYFYSVDACIVYIVSGRCNQSSSMFFYVIFSWMYQWIDAILNDSKSFPPPFLGTYSLSTSFLGWKALCIVMSLSWISMKRTAQVFITLMRFLQYSLVSSTFLVLLWYSFFFLSSPQV